MPQEINRAYKPYTLSLRIGLILPIILTFFYFIYTYCSSDSLRSLSTGRTRLSHERCVGSSGGSRKRIAIVGAGSAGASTAYYLRSFQPPCVDLDITIFERSNYVGGRSTTVAVFEDSTQSLELGASIFVEVNHNLVSAAREFGLELKEAGYARPKEADNALGVWDGLTFQFTQQESSYWWYDLAKLILQYGLAPIRVQLLMKKTVNTFLKMYDDPVFPFESLTDAAGSLGLETVTAKTGEVFLAENSITSEFANGVVQASTRVNYAQNLQQIHGMEAMVCMATGGAMAVRGGNYRIFEGMIDSAGANLFLNTSVSHIAVNTNGSLTVSSATVKGQDQTGDIQVETFDAVVLASGPFQYSDISLVPSSVPLPEEIPYVQLFVTLFTSPCRLSPFYFNLGVHDTVPEVVLTTLSDNEATHEPPFLSISTLRKVTNPMTTREEYAYKIFSLSPLNSTLLSALLGFEDPSVPLNQMSKVDGPAISWAFEKTWNSYPYLTPRTHFPPLRLERNLFYTSSVETFISTMETSSLIGKNIARLIANQLERDSLHKQLEPHFDM